MGEEIVHVYFVPGLAAGREIFRNISLPKDRYKIHILEWLIPEKKEPIVSYAAKMAKYVTENNAILVGVSFGGVIAQEMSLFLKLKKLLIISSIKTKNEQPRRLKLARKTLAYKLIPVSLVLNSSNLSRFAIGPRTEKRLKLYQEYLHVRDKQYLDWAIENMIIWDRTEAIEGVVHLHGDKDVVFPIKNISNCITIEGGTHIMLLNKGTLISEKLLEILENN